MKDILDQVARWITGGRKVALATVVATERSAPRDPGATLAVTEDAEVLGSVSGGCVEAAVIEEALEAIRSGTPRRVTYGITDEEGIAVGLSCGGTVHIFIHPLDPPAGEILARLAHAADREEPAAVVTAVTGPRPGTMMLVTPQVVVGGLGDPRLEQAAAADARAMLERAQTGARSYDLAGEREAAEVFVASFAPPARMYVFGATTQADAVARIGKFLGYRVVVCDARAALATRDRLPSADEIVVRWPDEFLAGARVDRRTVICVLTHDPKFDIPLLQVALATPAAYIGALGSRRTHEARVRKLVEAGVSEDQLSRVHAPIGLNIGARTPEEVAVSIAAEIIALRAGRPGGDVGLRPRAPAAKAGPP
ncbi:MAG TPA: XdhC/CoxI family protein [bacterium]|nr:XdhC/CoxI family protein [bacterium]